MAKAARSTPSLTFVLSAETNMVTFAKVRHKPQAGDLFVANLCGKRWIAGRVIATGAISGGFPGGVLLYFYRQEVPDPLRIKMPLSPDLACAPIIAWPSGWKEGLFLHVGNFPLAASERLPRHVLGGDECDGEYCDEFGDATPPPRLGEWCRGGGLSGSGWVDAVVSRAFGFMPKPELPGKRPEKPAVVRRKRGEQLFWRLIEQVRKQFDGSKPDFIDRLSKALAAEGPEGVDLFNCELESQLAAGDTWWLRGAAHVLRGPCTEPEFLAFRAWLISLGEYDGQYSKNYPDHLADVKAPPFVKGFKKPYQFAELLNVPATVYSKLTAGKVLPPTGVIYFKHPPGTEWSADGPDLQRMLPVLTEFVALRKKSAK